jgi:hypothetical protein
MKRIVLAILFMFSFAGIVSAKPTIRPKVFFAQVGGTHTGILTWTLSTDDTTTNCATPNLCSQNVYRAPGTCATAIFPTTPYGSTTGAAVTFTDNTPLFGNSCYAVTFIVNGVESALSAGAGGSLRPASPSSLVDVEK